MIVNIIPNFLSGETNQDSEPSLAVNPANPLQIAASAFTHGHDATERRPAHLPDGLLPKGLRLLRDGVLLISQKI